MRNDAPVSMPFAPTAGRPGASEPGAGGSVCEAWRRASVAAPGFGGSVGLTASATLRGCGDCGRLQISPVFRSGEVISCERCDAELEHGLGRSIGLAFAFSTATVLLLVPANLFPFVRTWVLGASRQSVLASSVGAMLRDGWPEVAIAIGLAAVVLPFVRFGLLSAVTGTLLAGRRPAWLGRAFRIANALQPWAMTEVFLLAFLVAFWRLRAAVVIELGVGGVCLVAAGIGALLTRAALDKSQVWRAIAPDTPAVPRPAADALTCTGCELVRPATEEGQACPRCAGALRRRRPEAAWRALALILGGMLLYIPANLLPLTTLPIGLQSIKYTVLEGVIDLVQAKLLVLAIIVFTASFAIPVLKLAGLGWCVHSVLRRSQSHLRAKTRAYLLVEEIGRWSMVDPFVISIIAPVMTYNQFILARAEPGAPFFTGVVLLTMLASRSFDPRDLWDAAGRGALGGRA